MSIHDDVKLRDKRKPGHCWQDNELYDAFGPVIGPNAILVYVQMSRNCYGTEIRSSSRELAHDSGLSKDTVLRALRAMERVGMLRAVSSGWGRVAEYHLTDLKGLAALHGATYEWKRQSYVFSALQTAHLKAIATGAVGDSSPAPTVAVGDSSPAPTVAVSDSSPAPTVAVSDSAAPQLSLQRPATVSPEVHPYTKQQDIQNNPPTPRRGALELPALRKRVADARKGSEEYFAAAFELTRVARELAPPAVEAIEPVHDPPLRMRRRRRGLSDGCSAGGDVRGVSYV